MRLTVLLRWLIAGTNVLAIRYGGMASYAFHPPIHLRSDPDRAIRSLEEVEEIVRAHPSEAAARVLIQIERVNSPELAEAAGRAFRAWAEQAGLLLVPPEDK